MAATTWRCFLVHVAVIHFLPVLQAANVALGKTATLSSRAPHWNRAASLATDGNTNTDFYAGSCVATAEQTDPWLRVDLGRNYLVTSVKLYLLSTDLFYVYLDQTESPESGVKIGSEKTFDECLELCRKDTENNCRQFVRRNWARDYCYRVTTGRKYRSGEMYTQNKGRALANLKISVSNTVSGPKSVCKTVAGPIQSSSAPYTCTQPVSGRYVWLMVHGDNRILSLCEVEVDGAFSYMANDPTYKLVTSHGFTVEWAACKFAENSQSTNTYKVEYVKKGSSTWNGYNVTGTSRTFTGRQHNTQYTVRIRCYWRDGSGALQFADAYKEITIKTLCKDPVQVTIDAVTPTLTGQKQNPRANVALAWQPISNTDSGCNKITSYDVQYSQTGSSVWMTASPSAGISTSTVVYTITNLEFNTQYKVRVKATNNDGKSSLGAEREATTKEGWSSAVQSLSLQHVAWSDSLSVSWQPPAHPRGTITRYTLSYQLTQRGTCARVEGHWSGAIPVTSPYRITRLDPHSEYRVKVVPVSGAGDGVEATMDARTAATVPSSAPTNVRDTAKTARSVTFEWTAVSCDKINGAWIQYRYTLQGIENDKRTRSGTSYYVTWTARDLVPYTLYSFAVTAVNSVGSSAQSDVIRVRTNQARSSAVQSLQHVAQSYSMRVTWQPPANRNGIITGYKVSYQLRQRGTCSEVNGEWSDAKLATSLYHDLTGLHPYSLYRVRVVPVNGAGDGAEATVDWRTASIVPSSAPTNVCDKAKTARSVTFEWRAISCDKINGAWIQYRYTLQGIEYDNRTWTGTSHGVTWTARDLVPYALYSFTVTAVNNEGSSAESDVIRVRTNETMPLPPVDVSISDIRTDSLTVIWKTPTPPYGLLHNYEIKYWTFNETTRTNSTSANETDFKLSSLQSVTNYSIQVRGRTGAGWGNWSDLIYGFTEEGVPGEPSEFEFDTRSTDSASFRWKEPLVKNGEIIGYKVKIVINLSHKQHQ